MSEGPRSRLALLAVVPTMVACSIAASDAGTARGTGDPSADGSGGDTALSCTPEVTDIAPQSIDPIDIVCPRGYVGRQTYAAEPISGRFTNQDELIAAFCVPKSS